MLELSLKLVTVISKMLRLLGTSSSRTLIQLTCKLRLFHIPSHSPSNRTLEKYNKLLENPNTTLKTLGQMKAENIQPNDATVRSIIDFMKNSNLLEGKTCHITDN